MAAGFFSIGGKTFTDVAAAAATTPDIGAQAIGGRIELPRPIHKPHRHWRQVVTEPANVPRELVIPRNRKGGGGSGRESATIAIICAAQGRSQTGG